MSQDSFETIGKEFGTHPIQTINAKLLQIFFRIQIENLDEKILRRLTRECLALEYAKESLTCFQGLFYGLRLIKNNELNLKSISIIQLKA